MGPASSITDMSCVSRFWAVGMLLGFVSLGGASSCLFHAGDRCDPGQNYDAQAGLCVCDASQNLVAGDHGCVACGEHEVAGNDVCSCADGYQRPSAGAVCAVIPEALGAACASDTDCADKTYDTCHIVTDGASYCTNVGCKSNDDCTGGYACNTSAKASYCERPPSGDGQSCSSDDDCEGTEATYCEIYDTHVCHVQGCSLAPNDCFPGQDCCDLSVASGGIVTKLICVAAGTCPH
jgi:hypothetical protein